MNRLTGPTLVAALCMAWGTMARSAVVADSVADFSGVQGQAGWYYGYSGAAYTPQAFTPFQTFSASSQSWTETGGAMPYWTSLWSTGGHPNGSITSGNRTPVVQWAIRRWVASDAGLFDIDGFLGKQGPGGLGGNGVGARVFVDGVEVLAQSVAGTDTQGLSFHLQVALAAGSIVDFALDPLGASDLYDSSRYTARISSVVPEPSTGALALAGLLLLQLGRLHKGSAASARKAPC